MVELLVVIAIIMILISILLPALKNAKNVAKAVGCMNNQRQNGTMILAQAADSGSAPFYADEANNKKPWFATVSPNDKAAPSMYCPLRSSSGASEPAFVVSSENRNKRGYGNSDYSLNCKLNMHLEAVDEAAEQSVRIASLRASTPFFPIKGIVNDKSGEIIEDSGKLSAIAYPSGTVMVTESWVNVSYELSGSRNFTDESFRTEFANNWDKRYEMTGEHYAPMWLKSYPGINLYTAKSTYGYFDGHVEQLNLQVQTWKTPAASGWYRPTDLGVMMWEGRKR